MFPKDWLIIYDVSQLPASSAFSAVLDLAVAITRSDSAQFYRMDPAMSDLRLICVRPALEDGRIQRICLPFPGLDNPRTFSKDDPGFDSFPETTNSQIANLLAIPIRVESKMAGILTLCRKGPEPFGEGSVEVAVKSAVALGEMERVRELDALRARLRTARQENLLLEKRLAERKLMERAKGLLQIHHGWTEEDAYYHLRRTSRQQRTPMAVIAQRVIDIASVSSQSSNMSP